ncbi:GNAT family N-acetyltransferase [Planctomycetota bacterium]
MAWTFHNLDDPESKHYTSEILTGIHEAGNPYYDWFFGGHDSAQKILGKWMARTTSEVSITRVKVLFDGDRPVGGLLCLSGAELLTCRKADMLALMKEMKPGGTFNLEERFAAARTLFPRVEPDVLYLSKIWTNSNLRGEGRGREILREFLEMGRTTGFRLFQLDVSADNRRAIRLYQSYGFQIIKKSSLAQANLEYLSMKLEEKK